MQTFNYQETLQKIITKKQLVEVRFIGNTEEFKVGYIFRADDISLILIEIDSEGNQDGICLYPIKSISLIKTNTEYLLELSPKLEGKEFTANVQNALKDLKGISIKEFCESLYNSNTMIEILYEDGFTITGKIIGIGNEILAIDEYSEDSGKSVAQAYVPFSIIERIALEIPYLKELAK